MMKASPDVDMRRKRRDLLTPALWVLRATALSWAAHAATGYVRFAHAQAAADDDDTAPPPDAPVMRPGSKVRRQNSKVEVVTFNRAYNSKTQQTTFNLQLVVINTKSKSLTLQAENIVRLVTDGLPRAPMKWFPAYANMPAESAQDCSLTFNVKGKPRIVHVQFGTDDEGGRDFLRWPD
jgi:hypothetical protein